MASPRASHSATVLANGHVLVTAGGASSGYTLTSELYDPATKVWTTTGALNTPARSTFTATLLPDGRVLVAGGVNGTYPYTVLNSAELYNPATSTWTTTGAMNTPRYGHTATLLSNGKVLVTGGDSDGSSIIATTTAELYDPSTNSWTSTSAMSAPRSYAKAVALPNGNVLVVGGYNQTDGYLSSAEIYHPTTSAWSDAGTMTVARQNPTVTVLGNGKVLVAGGYSGSMIASAELYDPAGGTWVATGSMSSARYLQTATLLPSGKVLAAGGDSGNNAASLSSAELYDPATGLWTLTGSLNTGRESQATVFLLTDQVLTTGGTHFDGASTVTTLASTELYDPANGAWTVTTSLDPVRQLHTASLLANGRVLLAGGQTNTTPNASGTTSATTRIYNSADATWIDSGPMSSARVYATATLLPNGTVFVAGGSDGGAALSSSDLYHGTWSPGPALVAVRQMHAAALLSDGQVLLAGGAGVGGRLSTAEVCNPSGTCGSVGAMASARQFPAATTLSDGRVLVTGGYYNGALKSAELYDPSTQMWTAAPQMGFARYVHTSTLLPDGTVLVVGGYGSSGELTSAEIYDPVANHWTSTGSLATARYYHTTTLLPNGEVLVTGGANFSIGQILASAELYKPATGTWTTIDPMHSIRYGHTATLLPNGTVLVAGGANLSNVALAGAELFVPSTGTWSDGISLSQAAGFQWSFSGAPGSGDGILASSDLTLPLASWTRLYTVFEISPGQFRFNDPQAGSMPQRFYRIAAPGVSGSAPASKASSHRARRTRFPGSRAMRN